MKLADVILRELRAGLMVSEVRGAPPRDVEAEAEILSAVVDGRVSCSELRPLGSEHFYSRFYAAVWEAAQQVAPGDIAGLRAALTTAGWRGELHDELFTIWAGQPFVLLPRLREHVRKLMELWARRELIRVLQQADAELRVGAINADGVRARLEQHFKAVLG